MFWRYWQKIYRTTLQVCSFFNIPNLEVTTEIFDIFLTPLIRGVFDNERQIGTEDKFKLTWNRSLLESVKFVLHKKQHLKQAEICRMVKTSERLDIIISRLFCRKSSSSMERSERVENFESLKTYWDSSYFSCIVS